MKITTACAVVTVCVGAVLLRCADKGGKRKETITVARVGGEAITARAFVLNYDFGLPHLKKPPDRKRSYLDYMIKEKLLAQEGYRLGLDRTDYVEQRVADLKDELLVEALFAEQVAQNITITPEEIRLAIHQSKTRWKMRYWVETTAVEAARCCRDMRARGFDPVMSEKLRKNRESGLNVKDFETDYVTWMDVDPELLEAVRNLPIGHISEPIQLNGVYFIFQIVDIRRESLLASEYDSQSDRMRQILYYQKSLFAGAQFVDRFMTPKKVRTKKDAFNILTNGLAEWKQAAAGSGSFTEAIRNADAAHPLLSDLRQALAQTLVTFQDGRWSISDFIARFDPYSITADPKNTSVFGNQVNVQIAVTLRNFFMIQEAERRGLAESESLQAQLTSWRDKWVYEAARSRILAHVRLSEQLEQDYFQQHKNRYRTGTSGEPQLADCKEQVRRHAYIAAAEKYLDRTVDSLALHYPVVIDHAVLDTISVLDSPKSNMSSVQLYKRGSRRMAVPIVDPAWGF